ncbi:MAG: FliH/SctL family protein [Mariprofundus sp.]
MSTLKPLTFPADKREPVQHDANFPFGGDKQIRATASAVTDNRMQQLEKMLQEAQGRAEQVEKEAYEKAYLAGEKAGMALGKKRGEQILDALQQSLQDAELHITTLQQSFAEAAVDVATHIAEQIVGETLRQDSSSLMDIANQAAAQLPDSSNLRIAVANDDYTTFKRMLDDDAATMRLCADATVAHGTCRIISATQDILIDPVAAVRRYMSQIEPLLLEIRPPSSTSDPVEHD